MARPLPVHIRVLTALDNVVCQWNEENDEHVVLSAVCLLTILRHNTRSGFGQHIGQLIVERAPRIRYPSIAEAITLCNPIGGRRLIAKQELAAAAAATAAATIITEDTNSISIRRRQQTLSMWVSVNFLVPCLVVVARRQWPRIECAVCLNGTAAS